MKQKKCIHLRIAPRNRFICIYFVLQHSVFVVLAFVISLDVFPFRAEKTRQTRSLKTAADINLHKAANQTEAATDTAYQLPRTSLKYTTQLHLSRSLSQARIDAKESTRQCLSCLFVLLILLHVSVRRIPMFVEIFGNKPHLLWCKYVALQSLH